MNKREQRRDRRLRKTYGITLADYGRMLKAQGGGCAICGQKPSPRRALDVDHHHKSGRVRGLLCHRFNRGLAYFYDNPERFRAAARYLGRRKALGLV